MTARRAFQSADEPQVKCLLEKCFQRMTCLWRGEHRDHLKNNKNINGIWEWLWLDRNKTLKLQRWFRLKKRSPTGEVCCPSSLKETLTLKVGNFSTCRHFIITECIWWFCSLPHSWFIQKMFVEPLLFKCLLHTRHCVSYREPQGEWVGASVLREPNLMGKMGNCTHHCNLVW